MENPDKIFEQLKQAAQNAESKEFPSMESVWSRVEDKLDNKALSKQNKKWKQWAVAASVVAVISVGYQFFRSETEKPVQDKQEVLVKDDAQPEIRTQQDAVAIADTNSALKKDAPQILNRQKEQQSVVSRANETSLGASAASTIVYEPSALAAPSMRSVAETRKDKANSVSEDEKADESYDFDKRRTKGVMAKGRVFDARTATSEQAAQNKSEKQKPLLIVDGKPLVAKTQKEYDQKLAEAMESVPTERDTVFYLKEPLYIIDGKEYSEQSLFGPNPTSPYAPLNLQEEGMKTAIYTGKDAVKRFGDKGKNGVVVVTTKNGKPSERKK